MFVHKSCDLIHVQVNIWDLLRPDIIDVVKAFQYAVQYIIRINFHFITPMYLLYSNKNRMARKISLRRRVDRKVLSIL